MNITNTLHKGPRLLVPIQVEGMVVDDTVLRINRGQWARNKAEYNNVTNNYGPAFPREIATTRSIGDVNAPEKGVHLQWILPKALRHGKQSEKGKLEFPLVPNRWLVMRTFYNEVGQLQLKGWVLISDHIRRPSRRYKGPYVLEEEGDTISFKQIGKVIPLEAWEGEQAYSRTKLTAVRPEDFTFGSYTVNNQNVFSFHDDLNGLVDSSDGQSLGYLVSGWYSNPDEDPLYQEVYDAEELLEKLEALQLDLGGENGLKAAEAAFGHWSEQSFETLSPLMFCHGSIHSIQWPWSDVEDKDGRPYRSQGDANTNPDIILGNSSVDVLLTFIEEKMKEYNLSEEEAKIAKNLLYAFDQKLLNEYVKPEGDHLLDSNIHRSWFSASIGGDYWEIVQNNVGKDDEEKKYLKQLLQQSLPILGELNKHQQHFDNKKELHAAKLQQLYTALYAAKNQRFHAENAAKWEQKALNIQQELHSLGIEAQNLSAQIDQRREELIKFLNIIDEDGRKSNFNLRARREPLFWEPNDPVVLVHAAKTSGKYTSKHHAICRYAGQLIDQLGIHETNITFSPNVPNIPNAHILPKELSALIKEFILLNPNYATIYFDSQLETVQKQQTFIWNSEKLEGLNENLLLEQAGFSGIDETVKAIRPDFRSFKTFSPPWSPLFMDWMVYFFPNKGRSTIEESHASQALECWELEEERMDFDWKEDAAVPPIDDNIKQISWTIQGRSLLTSQMPQVLIAKLKQFQEELIDPNQQATIDTIITLLDGFDLITQQLSGFNEYLQGYDISNGIPHQLLKPRDAAIDVSSLENKRYGLPMGTPIMENNLRLNQYFPVRGGHLLLHYTRIVDDFGIGFYPVKYPEPVDKSNVLIPQDTAVIPKGKNLNHPTIANTGLIQLPPRISQPSRIRMEWVDADIDMVVNQETQNSPVCGWIIPNHLDKSLMIFDAAGKLQGSLIFFQRGSRFYVKKALDPLSANPGYFNIQNAHLNEFINELMSYNDDPEDNGAALSAFLEQIDKTTWVTDPLGPREKRGVSALIGRPLALVRARVSMDLKGLPIPAFDFQQPDDYDISTNPNPLGLMEVDFPFFVGSSMLPNNGLVGYFTEIAGNTSYRNFQVVTDHSSADTSYIQEQVPLSTRLNHAHTSENDRQYTYLSMLLDYRGSIHTMAGLLPVFELELPTKFTKEALANMEVTFRTGPLITDPQQLRMPKPGDISGKLSWMYQAGVNIWKDDQPMKHPGSWENTDIGVPLEQAHFPPRRNQLNEGWMKLSGALKRDDGG